MVTLKQLRYLSALARQRHFGRAAQDCAVTQPALSMQIRSLEQALGVELIERRPGEVMLTDIGLDIAQRAEQVLTGARDLVDLARRSCGPLTGRLRLGVIPSLAPYLLPAMLPALQRRFPQLRVELRETTTEVLLKELARGDIDAMMLALPVSEADVETMSLFEDPFLLAVPADDQRPAHKPVTTRDIEEDRLLLLEEGHCLRDQALAYCAGPRRNLQVSLGATSLTTVMQMVANGYGVTLLPRIAADVETRDGRIKLLKFAAPAPGRTIGLCWRKSSPRRVDFTTLGKLVAEIFAAPTANRARRAEAVAAK